MHKLIYTAVALSALIWPATAFAVLQETTVTLTDNGEPLPEATITLNRITDSETPPEPKTEETDDSGKIVIVHDDKDKDSDSVVEIIAKTKEGKTIIRRIVLREFLTSETVDVALPSKIEHAGGRAAELCPELTTLDDEELRIILENPELRERIVTLIEEIEETEETEKTTETEKAKEPVSGKTKEKKAVQKKPKKQPTTTASQKKGSGAAKALGTGLSIGLGIAGSQRHHDGGSRHHMKGMDR